MKTDKSHIPEHKRKELQIVVETVLEHFEPNMIILYGSYARGNFVDIPSEYESDFDILIICGQTQKKNNTKKNALEADIRDNGDIQTRVHFQYESIGIVNLEIDRFNYLFIDIRQEGIALFDNKEHTLNKVKELNPVERSKKAIRDFKHWLKSSNGVFIGYSAYIDHDEFNWAAFSLHQAVEHLFMAFLLVHTAYKPKTHHLGDLIDYGCRIDKNTATFFPKETEPDKYLYDLLEKAYVDGRYNPDYKITEKGLRKLESWCEKFKPFVIDSCKKQLTFLQKAADQYKS